jgi:hypothetical protein
MFLYADKCSRDKWHFIFFQFTAAQVAREYSRGRTSKKGQGEQEE